MEDEKEISYFNCPGVSNSRLKVINPEEGGSPAKYKKYVIDQEGEKEDTPSLENGRIIHKYVEEPDSFEVADIDKPSEMMAGWVERLHQHLDGAPLTKESKAAIIATRQGAYASTKDEAKLIDKFIKEGKAYYDFLCLGKDKLVITSAQKTIINECIGTINQNKRAKQLLFDAPEVFGDEAYSEHEMYWKERFPDDVELDCKGMIDKLRILHNEKKVQIIDFKTTSKPISLYKSAFEFYRTYRQLAFYERGLNQTMQGIDGYDFEFYVVAIETYGLYECRVFNIPLHLIERGRDEYQKLLRLVADHTKTGIWTIEEETLNLEI